MMSSRIGQMAAHYGSSHLRVLMAHNYYQSRGGEDVSAETEAALLRQNGHSVQFITRHNRALGTGDKIKHALNCIWSTTSKGEIGSLLAETETDILHVQNFFPQFSPSIYYAAREMGVPVVQTLRNYRLLCPKGTFYRDGHVCEKCLGRTIALPSIAHACYRESYSGTAAVAAMLSVHRAVDTWERCIDVYIALSEFARQKMIAGGIAGDKIVVKPNFVSPDPGVENSKENFALFVGRLSPEKGIDTLLRSWKHVTLPLKVVGEGPLLSDVVSASERSSRIEYLGYRSQEETYSLMGKALLLVFPSEWYETFGRVLIEAFARGTPVVASRLGAVTEVVDHDITGRLFNPGDPDDLAAQVEHLASNQKNARRMGQNARQVFEQRYTADQNYLRLIEIYKKAKSAVRSRSTTA